MPEYDSIRLSFNPDSLLILNFSLGLIMFGVALQLRMADFYRILQTPGKVLLGIASQLLVLPFLTFLLVLVFEPSPSIALGLFMVAACPGGNISNFMALMARANVALSVSITAVTTVLSIIATPLNFIFWAQLYAPTAEYLTVIEINFIEIAQMILWVLLLPLVLGMLFRHYWAGFVNKIEKPIHYLSLIIFAAFVLVALYANWSHFTKYVHAVALLVFVHNAVALISGYQLGRLFKLTRQDCRSLSIETGIQNSGLGLILIFNFFPQMGGMALVAAWWGIWHIVSGLSLAFLWSKRRVSLTESTLYE